MKKVSLSLMIALAGLWSLSSCNSNASSQASETKAASIETPAAEVATSESVTSTSVEANADLPKFEFEEMNHDFGTIDEGEVVEHTFKFTNVGEAPLVIQSTSASCGCTTPSYSREPVAPGETGEVQVKFNSQSRPGVQNKTITITANTDPAVTRLFIKTNVTPKSEEVNGPVRK